MYSLNNIISNSFEFIADEKSLAKWQVGWINSINGETN